MVLWLLDRAEHRRPSCTYCERLLINAHDCICALWTPASYSSLREGNSVPSSTSATDPKDIISLLLDIGPPNDPNSRHGGENAQKIDGKGIANVAAGCPYNHQMNSC